MTEIMTMAQVKATTTTELATTTGGELAPIPGTPEFREHVSRGATELARIFRETTASLRSHWGAIQRVTKELDDVMTKDAPASHGHRDFKLELYYEGRHVYDYNDERAIETVIKQMNIKVWERLVDKMGIKSLMSIKRREEFDKQVKAGDVPEVTEENIIAVVMGLADRAADFATEAAKECLALLTPGNRHYKTNSGYKVGRRVVLAYYVERSWDRGFRPNYHREANLTVLDGTFHVLDEKGPLRDPRCPLALAIMAAGPDGKFETEYFKGRCFKNGNLHLEFRRADLVQKLNGLATGEFVLGDDTD